jgi:hypothetical protein
MKIADNITDLIGNTPLLTSLKDTLENLEPNNLSLQNQVTKLSQI